MDQNVIIDRDSLAICQVEVELTDTVDRGRVAVVRADSLAGNTLTCWADWPGVTPWQAWARPAAERRGVASIWDAVTGSDDQAELDKSATQLLLLWREACEREPLPAMLSIAGAPSDNSGTLRSAWIDALAGAIRQSTSGLTIITNPAAPAWALARCLPGYVGER